jgi:hypothetical protein
MHAGPDVTKNFLDKNGLELLVRSHEVKEEGYEVEHDGRCITVFSAPNYCDQVTHVCLWWLIVLNHLQTSRLFWSARC